MKLEYINNNPLNGIVYDFDKINKLYKSLSCPKNVYNPCHIPFDKTKWNIIMSDRSRGKTTNILLWGMCLYWLYDIGMCYIRSSSGMITVGNVGRLFNTIKEWKYVEKITEGEYNDIIYKTNRHEWYLVRYNEDGDIEKEDIRPFCMALSTDQNEKYKSTLATTNDFIIYDEFIERVYSPSMFLSLVDLIKTIGRDRQSLIICALSNTIDKYSPFFQEWDISDVVEEMTMGERVVTSTTFGTPFFIEIIGEKIGKEKEKATVVNRLYYGFKNPKLASITGVATWAMYNYPHTPEKFKIIEKNHYISYNEKLINLEICESTDNRLFINCHFATKTYVDSVIYSADFSTDINHRYLLGHTKKDLWLWSLYKKNLFTFANNSVGSLVEKYYDMCKKGLR